MTPKIRFAAVLLSSLMSLGLGVNIEESTAAPHGSPTRPEPNKPIRHDSFHSTRPESQPKSRPESRPQSRPQPQSRPESRPSERPTRPLPRIEAKPHKQPDPRPSLRPSERPGNRPESRPDFKPGERPGNRPESRPDFKPGERPGNRPESRPDFKPSERPGNHPESRPDFKPGERPGNRPNWRPDDRPDERPGNHPESRPDFKPGERPGNRPNWRPDDRPNYRPDPHHGHFDPHHGHMDPHRFHEPPMRHPLFFLPPPPPVYWQQTVIVLPNEDPMDGLYYYDDSPTTSAPAPSYDYLSEPQNRIYSWDVFRFYGWLQQYRPFHPAWVTSCDQGVGFAASYNLDQSRYYYYPPNCVIPGTEFIDSGTGQNFVFNPSAANQKLLPDVQKTLTPEEVDSAWDFIYGADAYYINGRAVQAEENYARAMIAQPTMPDPWFRLAVVEMARQNYPQAAQNAIKCLDLSQNWPASPFALDDMYKYQRLQKQRDLQALSSAASRDPGNSELQMLLGLMRYADSLGSAEGGKVAMNHFRNAVRLDPGLERYLGNLIQFLDSQTTAQTISEQ